MSWSTGRLTTRRAALVAASAAVLIAALSPSAASAAPAGGAARTVSATTVAIPTPTGTTSRPITGLACPADGTCVAVGSAILTKGTGTRPLLDVLNGTKGWRAVPLTLPAGATGAALDAVACASVTECYAVGGYTTAAGGDPTYPDPAGFVVTLSGPVSTGTWATTALPVGYRAGSLACPAAHQCVAAGAGPGGVGVMALDGTRITTTAIASQDYYSIGDIGCAAGPYCEVAVTGNPYTTDSTGNSVVVVDHDSITRADAPSTVTSGEHTYPLFLGAASCPSARYCGFSAAASTNDDGHAGKIEIEALASAFHDGGAWTAALAPIEHNDFYIGRNATPAYDLTCYARGNCTGAGNDGRYLAFLAQYRAGSVTTRFPDPHPVAVTPAYVPLASSCPVKGECALGVNESFEDPSTGAYSYRGRILFSARGVGDVALRLTAPSDGPPIVEQLLCRPGQTFCVAVLASGHLVTMTITPAAS